VYAHTRKHLFRWSSAHVARVGVDRQQSPILVANPALFADRCTKLRAPSVRSRCYLMLVSPSLVLTNPHPDDARHPLNRDPESWKRLGSALRAERQRQGLSREELAAKADVSPRSIQSAESGRVPQGRRPFTLDAIERALDWAVGSVDSVLEGGEPTGRSEESWRYEPMKAVPDPADELDSGDLVRFMVELLRITHLGTKAGASQDAARALESAAIGFIRSFPDFERGRLEHLAGIQNPNATRDQV